MFYALIAEVLAEKTMSERGLLGLLWDSDPVVKLVLLTLIFFSVTSWAIILFKLKQVRQALSDAQSFWGAFAQSKSLDSLSTSYHNRSGPLYEVFVSGMDYAGKIKGQMGNSTIKRELLSQKLDQAKEEELFKLEQYTAFLATTASTAPFIGLLGTVWGILTAFWSIGKAGSSSLATVGPYISEALIATAVGLFAAIPAVMAYNFFASKIKTIAKMVDLFVSELKIRLEGEAGS